MSVWVECRRGLDIPRIMDYIDKKKLNGHELTRNDEYIMERIRDGEQYDYGLVCGGGTNREFLEYLKKNKFVRPGFRYSFHTFSEQGMGQCSCLHCTLITGSKPYKEECASIVDMMIENMNKSIKTKKEEIIKYIRDLPPNTIKNADELVQKLNAYNEFEPNYINIS